MTYDKPVKVGLRQKQTNKFVVLFPETVQGDQKEIEKKVVDWYYKQSCSAEDELRDLFVDVATEHDLETYHEPLIN
jgi:hypothetical protein